MSSSDPRDPKNILQNLRATFHHFFYSQLPGLCSAMYQLPSKTLRRYVERDRRYDARQGPIGDPFRGFIDPGLADGIEERRERYEEYLKRRREERRRAEEEDGKENGK